MSTSITASFNKKYSDDVTHLASQKQSKFMDNVRVHRNVGGSTYDFHKMAGLTAATRTAGSSAEVTGLDAASTVVTATLADFEVPIYAQKFDMLKTNINAIQEYQVETVAAMNRKMDSVIITAMAAGATTTLTTTAGGLTYAKLLEAVTFFNANDVSEEDRIFAVSAKALSEALNITQLTSSDYVQIQSIMSGKVGSALGMKWVLSTQLPLATAARTCFAYNKKAVGLAVGKDMTTEINYVPTRVSTLINTIASAGAVVIDPLQICKMTTNE